MASSVRTFWKGYLRLALVAIPVRLVSAEKSDAVIRFHQIDRTSKQRIKYIKTVPGRGEVDKNDIVLAYEFEPGNYVFMEDADLDNLKIASLHTIELTQFVDADQIDPLYFERPYYILPDGDVAEEGYRIIRDALAAKRKCGIGQLTLRGKESLVALYAAGSGKGLVLDVLRYDGDIKNADEIFASLRSEPGRPDMVQMAEELIASRSRNFDASAFKNHYADAVRELVKTKLQKGDTVEARDPEDAGAPKIIDFMEALKKSLGGDAAAAKPTDKVRAASPKTAPSSGASGETVGGKKAPPADKKSPPLVAKKTAPPARAKTGGRRG